LNLNVSSGGADSN